MVLPLAAQQTAPPATNPEPAAKEAVAPPAQVEAPAPAEIAPPNTVLPPTIAPPDAVVIPPAPFIPGATPVDPNTLAPQMPTGLDIKIDGKITPLDGNLKRFLVSGPIRLETNRGEEVFANNATLDLEAKTYTLQGNVSVYSGALMQRGDQVTYNLETKKLDTSGLSASYDPILLESGAFEVEEGLNGEKVYTGFNAGITTHDVENPNYWLRADKTRLYPGEKVVFDDLRVFIGDQQVFWLPYLSQPLNSELGYRFVPGALTNWGLFLLNTYGVMLGGGDDDIIGAEAPWILSQWHVDMRSRRGLGLGVDLYDTRIVDNDNLGWLKFYFTHDLDPSLSRAGIPRGPVDPTRYRSQFQYRIPLSLKDKNPEAEYAINYDLHLLSDNHFLEDFDPEFYRSDAQPDNTIFLTRRTESTLLTGLARLRINDFYSTDSRTPEVSFDMIRRPFLGTSILHEGSISAGIYSEDMSDPARDTALIPMLTLADGDPQLAKLLRQVGRYEQLLIKQIRALPLGDPRRDALYQQLTEPEFSRFHTYQEFSTQLTFNDWLHLTPRIGAGYSRYDNVAGPATDEERTIFSTGIEASLKLKKDFPDFVSRRLGIDGLRHTLQPYAAWSYLSTSDLGADFPAIDRLTFTTRPVPINPGRFTAIDDLENWNLIRLGVRNRLITRRDGGSHEWLFMDTYIDHYLDDPELNREFSNLYNDITWSPLPWLAVELQTQFPVFSSGSGYNELTTGVRFMPTSDLEFSIAQSNLKNHPFLQDSNRVHISAYKRFNDQWGAGLLHQWEFDDGTLELEQYTLHRNYDNWIVSAGLTHRDNRVRDEYGFVLNFTIKDFPSVSLPFRIDAD